MTNFLNLNILNILNLLAFISNCKIFKNLFLKSKKFINKITAKNTIILLPWKLSKIPRNTGYD